MKINYTRSIELFSLICSIEFFYGVRCFSPLSGASGIGVNSGDITNFRLSSCLGGSLGEYSCHAGFC